MATAVDFEVIDLEYSLIEPQGFRAALDCDVIFSCVDRPWPRSVLNGIAFMHLIPIVDGGIQVLTKKNGLLRSANWRAHIVAPERRCMECLGQFKPSDVSLEREGLLDDPQYIKGLSSDSPLLRNENVVAFSRHVASMEINQFLLFVLDLGINNVGAQHYSFTQGKATCDFRACEPECPYASLRSQGDNSPLTLEARHPVAERARHIRQNRGHSTLKVLEG